MNLLWERHPLGSAEVVEGLAERQSWSPKTVRTLLGRLVKKGFLAVEEEGHRYLYTPAVPRAEYVRSETRSFVDRVFSGDPQSLLAHFVESDELSAADLKELGELLESGEESK